MIAETTKRTAVKVAAWVSWLGAMSMLAYVAMQPLMSPVRQWGGLAVVFLIGVAIALGLASSRYKLSDTIVAALQTGYKLSEEAANKRVREAEARAQNRHNTAMEEARAEVSEQKKARIELQHRLDHDDEEETKV